MSKQDRILINHTNLKGKKKMADLLAPLRDKQHIAQMAFEMHCKHISMGAFPTYQKNGSMKKVTSFEDLSKDFPQLPLILKNEIISQYKK